VKRSGSPNRCSRRDQAAGAAAGRGARAGQAAALADVCVEWGPFTDNERNRALADLEPLALGRLLSQKRVEGNSTYWVYVPPLETKAEADRRTSDLKARGVKDAYVIDAGPQRLAISLGVFRSEDAANSHLADLAKLGVSGARAGPRQQAVGLTTLVIRDPPAACREAA
jgi:hypothetical protein